MGKRDQGTNQLRLKLLPQMAWKGIINSGNVYYPHLTAGIFAVFTYFVFASILENDIIKILPKSTYAWMILRMGKGLLSVILLLFLVYANSFLVKRRQKEFGLYHILGLEKKHIGVMMFFESILLFAGALGGGILLGIVFAKLLFLLLLRICRMSMDVQFTFELKALKDTSIYFGIVYILNFAGSLWQIGKARPVELMSGSRKGEKEPRLLWLCALLGVAALGGGYYCSVTSKIDSMIFINFFMAVFLVIIGTYFLFTSGSITFLKWIKTKKAIYYRPENFITISGMFYRMKKNAAGLSNICIFSTMVMITLVCTITLCVGMDGCVHFDYPYDLTLCYQGAKLMPQEVVQEVETLEQKYDMTVQRQDIYDRLNLPVRKFNDSFAVQQILRSDIRDYEEDYQMGILIQEDYNHIENCSVNLMENETLIYHSGKDYGYDSVNFYGREFQVQREPDDFYPKPKAEETIFNTCYIMVVKDRQVRDECVKAWCRDNGVEDMDVFLSSETQYVQVLLEGADEEKAAFLDELSVWGQSLPGFIKLENGMEGRNDLQIMYGALLFIGVLFGLLFFMCLILIMYYKQITEGYEDRNNFDIMQKVGMSDREIRTTVHRQILMVFGMPLVGAVCHTIAGTFMVKGLLAVLSFFDGKLLGLCVVGVSVLFVVVYGVSYLVTAKTYYRIVRRG